jgi:phenylacetate-CoA ligase
MNACLAPPAASYRGTSPVFTRLPSAQFPARQMIRTEQLEKLRTLIDLIATSNLFYARKYAGIGVKRSIGSLEEFYQCFPFTTKAELLAVQRMFPPYGSNLVFPLNRYTRCHQTRGSTGGAPLLWLDTPESWSRLLAHWSQIYRAAEMTNVERLFFAFSFGPFLGAWTACEQALHQGCFCLTGAAMNQTTRLRAILGHGITVLCATPTYAVRLGETARQEGIDLSAGRVKLIITTGEPGGSIAATRARLAALWRGARIFDHYGLTEVGPVSYECPKQPGVLHIIESSYFAEEIDPITGMPSMPGRTGELVLTTLDRQGSPLLRYRTGDIVKPRAAGVCACGRHDLALEGGIVGRATDMVVVRGVHIYPSAVEDIIRACEGVAEYQVTLDTQSPMLELTVTVEPSSDCRDDSALVGRLESAFALRVPVQTAPAGALPRVEQEANRWIRV